MQDQRPTRRCAKHEPHVLACVPHKCSLLQMRTPKSKGQKKLELLDLGKDNY